MSGPSKTNPLVNPISRGTSLVTGPDNAQTHKWYPVAERLQTPDDHARALKQILDQHYALQRQVNSMMQAQPDNTPAAKGPPPGSGPTDTQLLGLRVKPVDTQTLANGATLKYNSTTGQFEFI